MMLMALALLVSQSLATAVPVEQDRLSVCLDQARRDPTTAISRASQWLGEASAAERAFPQQCLGQAYVSLLRWDAAEVAFEAAREATVDPLQRAKLGAMAGNASLPGGRYLDALAHFAAAHEDALKANAAQLAGSIATDRARAFDGLNQLGDAASSLAAARSEAPQYPDAWLLSATLARRQGELAQARAYIATAAALAPQNPDVALEAGVIAVLAGDDAGARRNWQAVQQIAPGSAEAAIAGDYLEQLAGSAG